jgi:hypothetical protein
MAGTHSGNFIPVSPLVTPEGVEDIGTTTAGVGAKLGYHLKGTAAVCRRESS